MNDVTLVYFEGCPEAKNIRAGLLTAGVFDFKVILQNELPEGDSLRKVSSPSVLKGHELVYGIYTNGDIASCTFDSSNSVDESLLVKKFRELKVSNKPSRNMRAFLGAGISTLLVLKCPACIPGAVAFLSALGLGFIITQAVLKSVLVMMLLLTLSGFLFSYIKSHKNIYPLMLGAIFSVALYIGRFHYFDGASNLTYTAVIGLIGTSIWDLWLKSQKKCSACA